MFLDQHPCWSLNIIAATFLSDFQRDIWFSVVHLKIRARYWITEPVCYLSYEALTLLWNCALHMFSHFRVTLVMVFRFQSQMFARQVIWQGRKQEHILAKWREANNEETCSKHIVFWHPDNIKYLHVVIQLLVINIFFCQGPFISGLIT